MDPAMRKRLSSEATGYILAIVCTGLVVSVQLGLAHWLADRAPLLPFVMAVMTAAWYGGMRPGLVATLLGALLGDYFFMEPQGFGIGATNDTVQLVMFVAVGVLVSGLCEALHRARRRAQDGQRHLENEVAERQEWKDRYEAAVHSSGYVLYDHNQTTGQVLFAGGCESILGHTAEELQGDLSKWRAMVHPDDLPAFSAEVEATAKTRQPFHLEYRVRHKDGTYLRVEDDGHTITDAHGHERIVGFVKNITKRKHAEEALRRSEARFRVSQEASLFGFTILHSVRDERQQIVDFVWEYANPAAASLLHRAAEELVGRRLLEVLPGNKDGSDLFREYVRVVETGNPHDIELPYQSEGIEGWFRNMTVKLDDGIAISFTDITEQKSMEQALQRHAEELQKQNGRLRLLWEAAGVLLSTDDPDTMLRSLFAKIAPPLGLDAYFNFKVNEAEDALTLVSYAGIPEQEARSMSRLGFGQAICGSVAHERQAIVFCDIQASDEARVQLVKRLGIRAYACNPLIAGDRLLGTLSFATRNRDRFETDELDFLRTICHYVTFAYERVRLVGELREADRRKDEFLATLAHELRNPLAPIRNGLDLLRVGEGDPARREEVYSIMDGQLKQTVRLIDDLLDLSRITRNKITLKKETVKLRTVVERALHTSRPIIDASGNHLEVCLPSFPLFLDADPTRLAQVFSNLLHNAAKFTSKGGHIRFSAERDGSDVLVRVQDSGIGIPSEMLPKIFEMFVQVDHSLERSKGGLGIGLTLVKSLVEMHGGSVSVRSPGEDQGSEFIVRLPLAVEATEAAEAQSSPEYEQEKVAANRRILVVDDIRGLARILAMLLEAMGGEVHMAHDGLEAIEAAEKFRPDVIFLDIGLPKLNGYQVAQRIRAESWGKNITLVAQTGYGQEDDRRLSQEAGFDYHLVKPLARDDLNGLFSALDGQRHPA